MDSNISGAAPESVLKASFLIESYVGDLFDSMNVCINVIPINDSPKISSPTKVNTEKNTLFQYIISVEDPDDSVFTYSFVDYPDWVIVVDSCISGIPTMNAVDTSFVAIVSDGFLSDSIHVEVKITNVSINENVNHNDKNIPDMFQLFQNYPNPFNQETTIYFAVPKEENINNTIFD